MPPDRGVGSGRGAGQLAKQGDEGGVDSGGVVGADEEPVLYPTASRRNARSEPLLWMGSRPSSRKS